MTDRDLNVIIGALLHDIGKVIYRDGTDKRTHSQSGYDYLKNELRLNDPDILNCVRYHHGKDLSKASIDDDSLAYAVYIADNIASSVDRRDKMEEASGFEVLTPLQPVFNLLNKNNGKLFYSTYRLNSEENINYPTEDKQNFTKEQYHNILLNLTKALKSVDLTKKELKAEYVNSLLEIMEANLSFVPSSTSLAEVPDISLYDHLKLTAAFAHAIVKYLEAEGVTNYKDALLKNEKEFQEKNAFILASLDISGIQKFIYTIQTKEALKTLRARSFYLEITMEHIIDELLLKLGLLRCNLLYAGGGHCYLILPNTDDCRESFDSYMKETNSWFLENFQTDLFIAGGYSECSASSLKNQPHGSYEQIFRDVSDRISAKKLNRYDAESIIALNSQKHEDYTRECSACKRVSLVNEDGVCPVCASLKSFSARVLDSDFFTIIKSKVEEGLPLPGGFSLIVDTEESLKKRMTEDDSYVRTYSKNRSYTGKHVATKLWVGDYSTKATFEDFAKDSQGINRVGILRADVDNLGQAFVSGFKNSENDDRYMTISRTATLSRQLSLFFKSHINKILNEPVFSLDGNPKEKRNITIVYSGGDDIFVVGAWNEIIEFAVDLRDSFDRFSEQTLSISAGIGLYEDSYPISVSAVEVEKMVDRSKKLPGKNAVTLLEDGCFHSSDNETISDGTYRWSEFKEKVIGEKYLEIAAYLNSVRNQHGNALLYRLLELIRNRNEPINFARLVYTLARLEPDDSAEKEIKEKFSHFSKNMVKWINNEDDCRQLKTAIELFVYLHRGEEEA